jgi:hypothetical protein
VSRLALLAVLALAVSACDSGGDKQKAAKPAAKPAAEKEPPPGPTQHFVSRPDLHPPVVKIRVAAHDTAPGLIFLAPKMAVAQAGPMIMDNRGQLVWFHPLKLTKGVTDSATRESRC